MKSRSSFGAHWQGDGVSFSVFSRHATAVDLCLYDADNHRRESQRLALTRGEDGVWTRHVAGVGPGQLYGYRVAGPYEPQNGHRFNAGKLLVDPWARAITGEPRPDSSLFGFDLRVPQQRLSYNSEDSAAAMPRCVVIDPAFDWGEDCPPRVPWQDSVIYECHVKGLTKLHPQIDPQIRGTYLGLAEPVIIEHLYRLGVTAVELLPIHQIAREPHLMAKGLANYWGYSTLGFFAPHAGYARHDRDEQVEEFKTMVRELHRAGIEVILDVVYNHTAEGGELGPVLSLKGLDNASYYRLMKHQPARYVDYTGCGNTLDIRKPATLRLVLDSLRYWVEEMHVDGFRFDLAPALGRDPDGFHPQAQLFEAIAADPLLAPVKMVAEPWDLGPHGYRLGGFPSPWREWNDRYRDTVRSYWHGEGRSAGELARCLDGSRDLFSRPGGSRGVSFVSCHDGFTLMDLVSFDAKHNEANLENNADGHNHNLSRNWGQEGPTSEAAIEAARTRARRNFMATLALSRGALLLSHGDELGRSQHGNNNAYCQDNEISWVDWSLGDDAFLAFVREALELRRRYPQLRGSQETGAADRRWLDSDGRELDLAAWDANAQAFAMQLATSSGALLALFNGTSSTMDFRLPEGVWQTLLDSRGGAVASPAQGLHQVDGFSLVVLEASSSRPDAAR